MKLVSSALDRPSSEREEWLRLACAGDERLFGDAFEVMQEEENMGTFLLHPMIALQEFPRPFETGQVITGRFEITKEIGEGGMGVVYEAFDRKRNLPIAIKSAKPGFQKLLSPELEGALTVRHRNVCRVNEIHTAKTEHGEVDFLTMELLEGETLSAYLKERGKLTEAEALPIARQLCAGLAEAHRSGVIHRDLKSANVILCHAAGGEVRAVITDFGLAGGATDADDLAGTPAYMAPELWRGEKTSKASDIYALGIILYEMVADPSLQRAKNGDAWEPDTDGLSEPWAQTIKRCLEADTSARPKSAEEVLAGLGKRSYASRLLIGLVVIAALAGAWVWKRQPVKALGERDTVVLGDFANSTGDAIFDDTLRTALNISLRQSPFLNVLSDSSISKTLKQMTLPTTTRLTPEVARELCQRTGSKAYLVGSIAGLGSAYVVGLKAMNCANGDMLAEEQATAKSKEKVLNALGNAASKLRGELGESLGTVQKFDAPLEATTSSLEALRAYSMGGIAQGTKGDAAAIPFYKHAIELDPNFALAYASLGASYSNLWQASLGAENIKKAYELRDRVSELEKYEISARYYMLVTGEEEKAIQTYQSWIQSYPNDLVPRTAVGGILSDLGQWDKAAAQYEEALRLRSHAITYTDLAIAYLSLNRLDDAKGILNQAREHKMDGAGIHIQAYLVAFLEGDTARMEKELAWATGKPGVEDAFLSMQSDTEAYYGRLSRAREFSRRAVESATRADNKETAAFWQMDGALREAELGNAGAARQQLRAALALSRGTDVSILSALTLARLGDRAGAQRLISELQKNNPSNTSLTVYWLPTINAAVQLNRRDAERAPALLEALALLEISTPYELGSARTYINYLYPAYVRGQAYLLAGKGTAAESEFQKLVDHRGIVTNFVTGALAQLQVGRAYAMAGDTAKAKSAYQDFLTLWKDADPNIPILREAKTEYAKLK